WSAHCCSKASPCWRHLHSEASVESRVASSSGIVLPQPYISLPMRLNRSEKRKSREGGNDEAVVYRDRASYALDAQLAALAAAGDDSAFTTLVPRFHPAVFRWALIFAHDPDEAEDITQEV